MNKTIHRHICINSKIRLLSGFLCLLLWIGLPALSYSQNGYTRTAEQKWVDSVYNHMGPDERIGQLFMIRAHSNLGADHIRSVTQQIEKYKVGGLCFFQGTAEKQIELVNRYQTLAETPLFISMDAEWGPSMRFSKNTIRFPRQLTLGAIQDNELIYKFGAEVARELKEIGVNINFAPVVDINNNPENPVINDRSFGEDKYNVAAKGYMYVKGLQDHGVLACAKHFPGHGDTNVDSHTDLPVISHDLSRLKDIELFPFSTLANTSMAGIMVGHLHIPALDDRKNIPTTMSENAVTRLLKDTIGFKGLIFTDGLEMQGITKYWKDGLAELKAFEAGIDILLLPEDLPKAFQKIKDALENNLIPQQRLEESVKKILKYKYKAGLSERPAPLSAQNINARMMSDSAIRLKEELIKNAITLVRDQNRIIPFNGHKKLISIALGTNGATSFQKTLAKFTSADYYQSAGAGTTASLINRLKKEKPEAVYVISLHKMGRFAGSQFDLDPAEIQLINQLAEDHTVVLVLFGSPYALTYFDNIGTVAVGYDDEDFTQKSTAEALFGKIPFRGRLPVSASPVSVFNQGITTAQANQLRPGLPEAVGVNGEMLRRKTDSLVQAAIFEEAMPGCEILVAKNNQIILEKAYGHHTYAKKKKVKASDIYDLASVTKVVAATAAVMKLYENGALSLDEGIGTYLPEAIGTNKADLTLRDIMAHRAGLIAWIPFYKATMDKEKKPRPSARYYRTSQTDSFSLEVNADLFLRSDYRDTIYRKILDSPLRSSRNYLYSDMGFYLIARIVENLSGRRLDQFVEEEIYRPLGMEHTRFQAYKYFPVEDIPPTEEDNYFRMNTVRGYVHDMGAAMLDGISGHAGLFSNARDLAVFFQMLLNGGKYGDIQIFQPSTIREFTTRHPLDKRRGIGFDMKKLNAPDSKVNTAPLASNEVFGHYGFTGTAVWADPAYDLIYIFLSNRTYPNYPNRPNLLSLHNYRSNIQNAIYESMGLDQKTPDISQ